MKRNLSIILARAANGAIGLRGKLPWSHPEDRAFFERTTRGHAVIMGRRTWEEEGRPLPDRINIIVSRTLATVPDGEGLLVTRSLDDALAHAWSVDAEPFVIGGAALFTEALPRVTRIYLTEMPGTPAADVFFELDRTGFRVTDERDGEGGARFLILDRDA